MHIDTTPWYLRPWNLIRPSEHGPGLESWGFMYLNADGKPRMAERRNVRSKQEAFDGLTPFVKSRLLGDSYRLSHMP